MSNLADAEATRHWQAEHPEPEHDWDGEPAATLPVPHDLTEACYCDDDPSRDPHHCCIHHPPF